MKVLAVADRPGWAFDRIARALAVRAPGSGLEIELFYLRGAADAFKAAAAGADVVFALHWSLVGEPVPERQGWRRRRLPSTVARVRPRFGWLDPARTLTGIHAHHDWDGRRTQPGRWVEPPPALIEFLAGFAGVNAVSRRLAELFRPAGLVDMRLTPNGVDTATFRPTEPLSRNGPLRVGYAGTRKRDWKEGISEYVDPLAAEDWLEVRLATPEDNPVPPERMPAFYNSTDVYVCASASEGFSLAVLEAAACGRPIVSTRVGGSEDLVVDGVNGYLIERSAAELRDGLRRLADDRDLLSTLGAGARRTVEERWSWDDRAPAWLDFLREAAP